MENKKGKPLIKMSESEFKKTYKTAIRDIFALAILVEDAKEGTGKELLESFYNDLKLSYNDGLEEAMKLMREDEEPRPGDLLN